jgi:hypothetical protein
VLSFRAVPVPQPDQEHVRKESSSQLQSLFICCNVLVQHVSATVFIYERKYLQPEVVPKTDVIYTTSDTVYCPFAWLMRLITQTKS